jgi:hypothetical protein
VWDDINITNSINVQVAIDVTIFGIGREGDLSGTIPSKAPNSGNV